MELALPAEKVCLPPAAGGFAVPSWRMVITAALVPPSREPCCLGLVGAWFSSCLFFLQMIFSTVFKDEVIFGSPHGLQEPCGVGSESRLNPILNTNLSFFFFF